MCRYKEINKNKCELELFSAISTIGITVIMQKLDQKDMNTFQISALERDTNKSFCICLLFWLMRKQSMIYFSKATLICLRCLNQKCASDLKMKSSRGYFLLSSAEAPTQFIAVRFFASKTRQDKFFIMQAVKKVVKG